MLRVALFSVLWAAAGYTQPLTPVSAPLAVGVFMQFDSVPGAASLAAMEKEVTELLKPSGVALDWLLTAENQGNHSFASLVVLRFRGSCKVDPRSQPDRNSIAGETHALGVTRVADGHVLPFSEIECDQVSRALSYLRPTADFMERQAALGRILGRVVAHEFYHILAHTTRHGSKGLARPEQSLEDLVSERKMNFQAKDARAIERALRPAL